jgi:dTDP-4-amino-4,6-dideoxygalactose transaminase
MKIPFLDFQYQNNDTSKEILNAIKSVFDSKDYILGTNVSKFEERYSDLMNIKFSVGVGSGLDALSISLKALDVKPGDEVIVASNAYIASWLSISNVGATIVPVEPNPETFNIDPSKIEEKITSKTKVIMPVHLFGQSCEMDKILKIARKYNLYIVEDNAQAHLAKYNSKFTGTFGDINATSFYPSKNLGAIGEAGCITTDNKKLSDYARNYRNYGSKVKYENEIIGSNSRIDEIQASILNVKLDYLKHWTNLRLDIASKYDKVLTSNRFIQVPKKLDLCDHVYHLYVIKTDKRDELQSFLQKNGVGTSIHYPIPPHLQKAYNFLGFKNGDYPIAEKLAKQSLSLPLYPGIKNDSIDYITNLIFKFFKF